MLRIEKVSKTFFAGTVNERAALVDVDLHLRPGDFVTVIGSNGAGKSTLLNAVAGKVRQDSGRVLVADQDVSKLPDWRRAAHIGRVVQDPMAGTAPSMTIEENLAIAYRRGVTRGLRLGVTRKRQELFRSELSKLELGLENRLTMKVGLLSGGQRQALSLLMATFTNPTIVLLDEHTAALDPQRVALISRLTETVVAASASTTLMVTHNMEQALKLGNRLILMHEGRIVFEFDEARKKKSTVKDLLNEFDKIKGAALDDRTLFQ